MRSRTAVSRLVVLALAAAAGCGGSHAASAGPGTDGGGEHEVSPPVPVTGRLTFDVVAHLRPDPTQPKSPFGNATLPSSDRLTLVLDADPPRFIVGGGGAVASVPATTTDGVTFRATMPVRTARFGAGSCSQGLSGVRYSTFEVTVDGTKLTGKADGAADFITGDTGFFLALVADLEGGPDQTAPFIIAPSIATSPFDPIGVMPSEPLPGTATARLVSSDGSHVDLVPNLLVDVDPPIIQSFSKPAIVLHPGGGYQVDVGGLVDFAGHTGATEAPLRIATIAEAPLIAEDGFESATGTTVGGAGVVTTVPAPLAGAASVYVTGTQPPPTPPGVVNGKNLFVRLPRQPGDTKVRFSYRMISTGQQVGFAGVIYAGSVDEAIATPGPLPIDQNANVIDWSPPTPAKLFASGIGEATIDLEPSTTATEVIVLVQPSDFRCGFGPQGNALVIDDLRAE